MELPLSMTPLVYASLVTGFSGIVVVFPIHLLCARGLLLTCIQPKFDYVIKLNPFTTPRHCDDDDDDDGEQSWTVTYLCSLSSFGPL